MNFETMVARYRKTSEMIDELKEYVNALTSENSMLLHDILEYAAKHPEVYNVFTRKNCAAGIAGRNLFTVTFSEQLERIKSDGRLDDQEWLEKTDFAQNTCKWVGTKRFLRTSKIVADYKAGGTTIGELEHFNLRFRRVAHVTAKHIPTDAQINNLSEAAEALIEEIGA